MCESLPGREDVERLADGGGARGLGLSALVRRVLGVTDDRVGALGAVEDVGAGVTPEGVVALAAGQAVVARAAVEDRLVVDPEGADAVVAVLTEGDHAAGMVERAVVRVVDVERHPLLGRLGELDDVVAGRAADGEDQAG